MNKKMSTPYFSVVIPVFNRASSILPVLESVIAQTFSDWEAIVVDDGSKDVAELEKVVSAIKDNRVRLVKRENGGGGAARNTGIDAAKGKYIALLDSDDFFLKDKLSAYHRVLEQSPRKIQITWSRFHVDRGNGKDWIKPSRGPLEGERIDEYLTCTSGWIQTSTMVVERMFASQVRFSEKLPSSQDTDFAIRCFLKGANFKFIEKCYSIMDDAYDPSRVSKQTNVKPLLSWIEGMKGDGVSSKSYLGYRGWQCARIQSESSVLAALKLFIPAVLAGSFSFKTAVRVFLQIVISQESYQKLMTFAVTLLGRRLAK